MAFQFGDGFDLYTAPADMITGYWDSNIGTITFYTFPAGRFAGSRALFTNGSGVGLVKSSGANDALHHFVVGYAQGTAFSGTITNTYIQLGDGAAAQCTVGFRQDGAIVLQSGGPAGATLATYVGASTAINTWYAFEIEVFISNTAGYMNVRKNGNTVNDFTSATNLNTRAGTANNYANRLTLGSNNGQNQFVDDFFWRSDASSVPWVGDIRCFTRMPASDVSVQYTRLGGATNFSQVSEAQQDSATSYVFDSTPGHADLYGIGSIASTPVSTVAVTTRGYMQKSDAGTRTAAVQLKSGGTTVASPTLTLSSSGWLWTYRTDIVDPATGAAWTAAAVNNVNIGPTTIA